ncbi:MAG: hypothetical protein MHPSP_003646, partial [Paramarteilia canceri]
MVKIQFAYAFNKKGVSRVIKWYIPCSEKKKKETQDEVRHYVIQEQQSFANSIDKAGIIERDNFRIV